MTETTKNIVDRIEEDQQEVGNIISSAVDVLSYVAMFPFYVGLFQMFSEDEIVKLNGVVVWIIGILMIAFTWYGPNVLAAYHVVGKKYLTNYVFYGSRMVKREMELINDPLVVARMVKKEDEPPEITTLDEQDEEVAYLMSKLGTQFLSDGDIDKRIDEVIKERYERKKEENERNNGRFNRIVKTLKRLKFWGDRE